jgi:hypothetical protein
LKLLSLQKSASIIDDHVTAFKSSDEDEANPFFARGKAKVEEQTDD